MKEQVEINNKTYFFKGYRIPENYKLPNIYQDGEHILDPEALFESEDGELFGLHPLSNLVKEE